MSKLSKLGTVLNGKTIPKNEGIYPAYGGNGIICNVDQYNYPENTIIIGRVGAYCGSVHFSPTKCWVTDNALAFVVSDNDPYFVYCLLRMLQLNRFHIGSSQPLITQGIINNIEFGYTEDVDEQRQISNLIKILDDKITNNNAICSNLEAMAKLLYDYWFVQFDFPDENGKPYKSSGGKMVWNEELKREIPEGWEVKPLYALADYATDKISACELTSQTYIGMDNLLPNMQGRTTSEYTPGTGFVTAFAPMDTIIGNIRPYFKKIWLADIKGGSSPDVLVIRAKQTKESLFIYSTLAREQFFDYDTKGAKGSKMPRGDKEHIMKYPIAYSNEFAVRFAEATKAWMSIRVVFYEENQQLVSLRDFLLPMLMNGQVKISPQKKEA